MTREELNSYILNKIMFGCTANPKQVIKEFKKSIRKTNETLIDIETDYLEEIVQGSVCIDGFYFKIVDEDKIKLVFYDGTYSELDLSDCIDIIGDCCFYKNKVIRKVSGAGINSIEDNAFSRSTVKIANFANLVECGRYAFDTSSLEEISIPRINRIESRVFSACHELTKVNADACTYIGHFSFSSCTGLREVNFPNCEVIAPLAFEDCYSLEKVRVADSTYIADNAFSGCLLLKKGDEGGDRE